MAETFVLQIRSIENDTWQGSLTWTGTQEAQNFRSALELFRLIDSAIGEMKKPEESEEPSDGME